MIFDLARNLAADFEDSLADRQEAGRHGWRVDEDGWYVRRHVEDDVNIPEGADHFGFILDAEADAPAEVYVRTAAYALAYDRGEITPWERMT